MPVRRLRCSMLIAAAIAANPTAGIAGPASELLPAKAMLASDLPAAPAANEAFAPGTDAGAAPPFAGILRISPATMLTKPSLEQPLVGGRDTRLFPGVTLEFFTDGAILVPVQRGEMVRESAATAVSSYWRVIPQYGRVWREQADGEWSRAAFPLMLVNDTENHAHQGLLTFLYREGVVSALHFQFVQQTAPYLVKPHFVGWGIASASLSGGDTGRLEARRAEAAAELAERLPARPWSDLVRELPAGTLDGFGGPLYPKWMVEAALVRNGVLYYQDSATPYGPFPYPLEMRFGVRSGMKSVGAPLALLHLAQVYGPYVLALKIGDYVDGIDPKYKRVRFIDAASMASGFGGTGTLKTNPNDMYDGYLGGNYDAWYTAPSHAEKIRRIAADLRPYPWEPGTVVRYRDQDFYLLGAALEGFLKSVRGSHADLWDMLKAEVFAPIGIRHAPAVRTRESDGRDGLVWFSAGYYPSLDDLAKIALLYQDRGAHGGVQILHRQLTGDLLAARDALAKTGDASIRRQESSGAGEDGGLYRMGFHFTPYVGSLSHKLHYLPTMSGSGENEVILYPTGLVSIRTAKAGGLPESEKVSSDDGPLTIRAVDRLAPF
jgi:CubicO group peptidase (beta-lactamase class C family)